MTFRTWAALAITAFVVAPLVAHLLRRRPPEEQPFVPTRLVPPAHAIASRRTAIEDRTLFLLRALSVLALAVLGATPLFRCSRLTVARPSGASVALALVIDDSLSMRARASEKGAPRLTRALQGARELVGSLQQGDAVAVVLAGRPARVALAATTNLDAARAALDTIEPSDRGTDLDGALAVARDLVSGLEHVDKRVVVLSDLEAEASARVASTPGVSVWAPLPELHGAVEDCAVIHASRSGTRVTVRVACTKPATIAPPASSSRSAAAPPKEQAPTARRLAILAGDEVLGEVPVHLDGSTSDLGVTLSDAAVERHAGTSLRAVLRGGDAIPEDDDAPVLASGSALRAAIVVDPVQDRVPTGGAPLVEQALHAMDLGVELTPMATLPEPREDLDPFALLILEDVPGFTPSQRRELGAWVERGGVALATLGPRAASAPLGSSFGALVPALVRWRVSPVKGLASGREAFFADASDGLDDLAPRGRASLELESGLTDVKTMAEWQDGAPFLLERRLGRGLVWATTLPLGASTSDFGLRPALFALLERLAAEARSRAGTGRVIVGGSIAVPDGVRAARFVAHDGKVTTLSLASPAPSELSASRAGRYELDAGGATSSRVASLDEREFSAAPLELPEALAGVGGDGGTPSVDVSSEVALVLLALLVVELLLRAASVLRHRRSTAVVSE